MHAWRLPFAERSGLSHGGPSRAPLSYGIANYSGLLQCIYIRLYPSFGRGRHPRSSVTGTVCTEPEDDHEQAHEPAAVRRPLSRLSSGSASAPPGWLTRGGFGCQWLRPPRGGPLPGAPHWRLRFCDTL